jgi:hypothetical protein
MLKKLLPSLLLLCVGVAVSACSDDQAAISEAEVEELVAALLEDSVNKPQVEQETRDQSISSDLTLSQQNAIRSAQSYLDFSGFSRQGLIEQLSSEYGEGFPVSDAIFAVDSLIVDWKKEAVESAESYLEFSSFSCQGLIEQLSSEYGSQFTIEEATYAANAVGLC